MGEKELGVISSSCSSTIRAYFELKTCSSSFLVLCIHLEPTSGYCSVLIAWSETIDGGASDGTWPSADETNAIAETGEGNYVGAGVMIVRGCYCCCCFSACRDDADGLSMRL